MKSAKYLLASVLIWTSLAYSQDADFSFSVPDRNSSSLSMPVPQAGIANEPGKVTPPVRTEAAKKWTIMIFINSKNNLEMAGLYNVNKMEEVGSTKDINIVVEMGRMNGQAQGDTDLDGNWTGVRRYLVKKDTDSEHITSPIVFQQAHYDMGDYKQVVSFANWTKQNYPAQRYMLILWDHGSGWLDPQQKTNDNKGISFDDETNNYIRTKQIGQILRESGKVDILAFDACLMQMGEVLSEVRDNTVVVVGSEETIPGTGYPYDLWLAPLAKRPSMSDEQLGAVMVKAYKTFYTNSKQSAMLSAIRSSKVNGFNAKMAAFASAATAANDLDAIKKARTNTLRFDILGPDDAQRTISFYGDVFQFADIMGKNITKTDDKAAALRTSIDELKNFISTQLVIDKGAYGNESTGKALADAGGVSIYLPPAETKVAQAKLEGIFEAPYSTFEFDKATKWHDFVTFIYNNAK